MKSAAAMIVNRATADECVRTASGLFWISAARSAVRARSRIRIARAIDRFPGLGASFNCDGCLVSDPSGLHTLVCDINRGDLKEQLAEVEASDLDDDEESRKRSKCHTRLASWPPKGRSVVGITVLDEEGTLRAIRMRLWPPSRTGSLSLVMLLVIVVHLIVSPGLCRNALKGLSP